MFGRLDLEHEATSSPARKSGNQGIFSLRAFRLGHILQPAASGLVVKSLEADRAGIPIHMSLR